MRGMSDLMLTFTPQTSQTLKICQHACTCIIWVFALPLAVVSSNTIKRVWTSEFFWGGLCAGWTSKFCVWGLVCGLDGWMQYGRQSGVCVVA